MSKTVFITGISTGIGFETARHLSQSGYDIIGTVRKETDKKDIYEKLGPTVKCIICDITSDDAVDNCVIEINAMVGDQGIYALINNAGIAVPGPMHLLSDEDFFRQMNVNLIATRKLTNKILPVLRTSKQNKNARIIFISSISGIFAAPFNGGYCVSKHALECLIDIYRRELKFLNIDVIAIQPGPIKSQIWNKAQGMFDQYMHGEFEAIARKADKIIQSTEKNALPVDLVSKRIHKILEMKRPKHRYMIHKNSLLFKLVAYYMPTQWVDKLIWKNLNNTDTDKYRPV